jgi:hypothetical protein
MIKYWIFLPIAASFLLCQVCVTQWSEIQSLRREVRLMGEAKDLVGDQVRELNMALATLVSERDSVATKNFVMGVVEATKKPGHYDGVWHDGYNQGMEQVRSYTTDENRPR